MLVCNDLASNIMRTNCGIQKGGAGAASFRILDKIHKKDVPFFIATLLGVSDSVQYIHSANDLVLYFRLDTFQRSKGLLKTSVWVGIT